MSTEAQPAAEASGFEAIVQVDVLETLFESVGTLVDECRVHLTGDGLEICAVDPANVAMVDAELDASAFESYRAEGGLIGLNVSRILDVLSVPDSEQLAQLYYDPSTRKLVVEAGGFEYTLALIDPDSIRQEPDIPDLGLEGRIVIEGEQLDRALTAAEIATGSTSSSGQMRIRMDENEAVAHFEADGDTDDVDYTFDRDDATDIEIGAANSLFSLDYWNDVAKPIGDDTRVSIRVGEEFPARLAYSDIDGRLHLDYMISPRVGT
jgi:proliferating cell nuclear antigen